MPKARAQVEAECVWFAASGDQHLTLELVCEGSLGLEGKLTTGNEEGDMVFSFSLTSF